MDVALMRGPFPGNLPPTVTLNASATTISTGGSITFTANATDPNGDPLAYHWDFSDGYVSPNAAVLTRSFPTTDQQTVLLTVSDMKGGSARAHVVVNIGSHGRGNVRGRITAASQPLMGVLVTSDTNKYCYTDSNGEYAIADLTTGSHPLTASLAGYTFTAGFTNPVAVTATTITNCNWTADSVPEVTISATDAARAVRMDHSSSRAPAQRPATSSSRSRRPPASPPRQRIIRSPRTTRPPTRCERLRFRAARRRSRSWSPRSMTQRRKDPRPVRLQAAPGAGYQVRQQGVATLVIADDDTTTRPIVSIAAADGYATRTRG
jgi:hypothetical protein